MVKNNDVAILIITCDLYLEIAKLTAASFVKYGVDKKFNIYIYNQGLLSFPAWRANIKTFTIPDHGFCRGLKHALETLSEKWVITWIDDRPLLRRPNFSLLNKCILEMEQCNGKYVKLITNPPISFFYGSGMLGSVSFSSKYIISFTVALWNKDYIKNFIDQTWAPWDIEKVGGEILKRNSTEGIMAFTVSFKSRPFQEFHLIIKRRYNYKIIKKFNCVEQFKKQNFISYAKESVYPKVFIIRDFICSKMWS